MHETLMSLAEAARQTGVDASTLRHAIKAGKLKAIKPGHDWLVYLVDVQTYINDNNVRPRRPHKKPRKSDPSKQG
jgi:excisionase family DNA binding protein